MTKTTTTHHPVFRFFVIWVPTGAIAGGAFCFLIAAAGTWLASGATTTAVSSNCLVCCVCDRICVHRSRSWSVSSNTLLKLWYWYEFPLSFIVTPCYLPWCYRQHVQSPESPFPPYDWVAAHARILFVVEHSLLANCWDLPWGVGYDRHYGMPWWCDGSMMAGNWVVVAEVHLRCCCYGCEEKGEVMDRSLDGIHLSWRVSYLCLTMVRM